MHWMRTIATDVPTAWYVCQSVDTPVLYKGAEWNEVLFGVRTKKLPTDSMWPSPSYFGHLFNLAAGNKVARVYIFY